MGARSISDGFLDWMKRLHRPFPLLVLVPVLFVMIPQMALVDSDEDGILDLPVITICTTHIADPSSSTRKDSRTQKSHNTVVPAVVATQPQHLEADSSDFVFHHGRAILQAACLLRC